MVDTQHFCLRWNNYQSSITSAFENLRDDEDFVDVTLACEGKSLKAHRVVLSACSPYFRELLKSTPCKHPVIVLQDVSFSDLHALVEFIYHGEVNVHQRSLSTFLKTAELLRVSGLTQQTDDREELGPSVTRQHPPYPEKLSSEEFPCPISSASSVSPLRRPLPGVGLRRDSESAGLVSEYDLSIHSKRAKQEENSNIAVAASIMQHVVAAAAVANQTSPEDFSPKSRRSMELNENNHHDQPTESHDSVKPEPSDASQNVEVDTEDSQDGRADRSSVASGPDETDNSAQGPPPGHFHVPEKLQSLFSGSPSPAFNFNLPVSRQALSDAASLSGLANAAGLGNQDLGVGSQGAEAIESTPAPSPPPPTPPSSWAGKFECEVCGKVLGTKLTLKRHKEQQHLQPLHSAVCPICYKVFRTMNSLNNHRSIYHRRQKTAN